MGDNNIKPLWFAIEALSLLGMGPRGPKQTFLFNFFFVLVCAYEEGLGWPGTCYIDKNDLEFLVLSPLLPKG